MAEDSRALEVVDVSDDGAVAAHALFDIFSDFIRFGRAVDDAFIKRRHGAGDIVRERCLAAFGIPYTVLADELGQEADEEPEHHLPFAFEVHRSLHAIEAGHTAFARDEAAHEAGLPRRRQFFRTGIAALGNGDDAFGRADQIVRADDIFCIFFNDVDNIIFIRKDSRFYRY